MVFDDHISDASLLFSWIYFSPSCLKAACFILNVTAMFELGREKSKLRAAEMPRQLIQSRAKLWIALLWPLATVKWKLNLNHECALTSKQEQILKLWCIKLKTHTRKTKKCNIGVLIQGQKLSWLRSLDKLEFWLVSVKFLAFKINFFLNSSYKVGKFAGTSMKVHADSSKYGWYIYHS